MKVLVTGGTGFVGCHTVAELVRAGHTVRLLARSLERVGPALEPLGVYDVEVILGDVTDAEAIERGIDGCDSVVHCASVYSLDARADATIRKTNVQGTEVVLGTAYRLGLDPIVHVSSTTVLLGTRATVLTPDSPPTTPPGAYARSKADSDRIARRLQDAGAPVVITYPSIVWGPHDPHFGETCQAVANLLRGLWVVSTDGLLPICDVRDLAKLHVAVLEKDRGPRRYAAPNRPVTVRELFQIVSRLIGRRLVTIPVPPWMLLGPMQLVDAVQRLTPFRLPYNFGTVYSVALHRPVDDSATRREFGIEPRDVEDTIGDTLRWMVETGRLPPHLAGRISAVS